MKKLLILSLITLSSGSAFARLCHVEMVSNTGRVLDSFIDRDDDCAEAMRECKTQIRLRGYTRGLADCYLRRNNKPDNRPSPNPYPNPYPQPNPYPTPNPYPYPDTNPYPYPDTTPYPAPTGYDSKANVYSGDVIVYNSRKLTVIGTSYSGTIAAKDQYGYITNNIRREEVAVTKGCNYDICVGDAVIAIYGSAKRKVAGLGYNNTFALVDDYGYITQTVKAEDVARTSGCVSMGYSNICVGNQVVTSYNTYKTVAAIQPNGRVVLRDSYGYYTVNVDPRELVVTR